MKGIGKEKARELNRGLFLFIFINIKRYVLYAAVKYLAQVVNKLCRYTQIMPQTVYRAAAYTNSPSKCRQKIWLNSTQQH